MLLREMTDELLSGKSLERDLMLRVVRDLHQCGPVSSSRSPCFVSVSDKRARDLKNGFALMGGKKTNKI